MLCQDNQNDVSLKKSKHDYDIGIVDFFLSMQSHKLEYTAYMLKTVANELDVAVVIQFLRAESQSMALSP